jgi:hypothetical protein
MPDFEWYHCVEELKVKPSRGPNIVDADLMELCPPFDPTGMSAFK